MSNKCIRGSERRKWDLHFHTPSSFDYEDKSVTNQDIIEKLKENNISVVAITDHHVIDTLRIRELQKLGEKEDITVLPGIELRCELGGSTSVHFIGIFPENSNIEDIRTKIAGTHSLTDADVQKIGNDKIYVDLKETAETIKKLGGIITIHGGTKTNSVESLKDKDAVKNDIVDTVDIFELGKVEDRIKIYEKIVFPSIGKSFPLIICSDNHNIRKYEIKENLWIKADTNFEGLKQIIYEPNHGDRLFIGEEPPIFKKVNDNKTKYIKNISINWTQGYDGKKGIWFKNVSIPFNNEFVSIIGNKGSGKSAISDILGFVGNSKNSEHFSFLGKDAFKHKNVTSNLAKFFDTKIEFQSGESIAKNLNEETEKTEVERVKYLPQGFFEELCNEKGSATSFSNELNKITFSYVKSAERLGCSSFEELLKVKKSNIDNDLVQLRNDLSKINIEIIDKEKYKAPSYITEIKNKLKLKEEELKQHENAKPKEVQIPKEDESTKKAVETLTYLRKELSTVEDNILKTNDQIRTISEDIIKLGSIKYDLNKIENLQTEFATKHNDFLSKNKIEQKSILDIQINSKIIDDLILEKDTLKNELNKKLLDEFDILGLDDKQKTLTENSLLIKKDNLKKEIKGIENELDEPNKKYSEYLTLIKERDQKKKAIEGENENTPDSLSFYKYFIKYIEEGLDQDLNILNNQRIEITKEIFKKRIAIVELYDSIKTSVETIIKKHSDKLENYKIEIKSGLNLSNSFFEDFLYFIDKRQNSYFREDGDTKIKAILNNYNINTEDDIIKMLLDFIDKLNNTKNINTTIKNISGFYDFLFSLDYLEERYDLYSNDTPINQLSPGQRGALLLVFYLLLDKDDIPLIIDQPEDNLDNQSISDILVPFIKLAKEKRQIILVTHNPNLAVVADADQIIHVNIDKKNNNEFGYNCGSIENIEINKTIIDILEGRKPAFDKRKLRYNS